MAVDFRQILRTFVQLQKLVDEILPCLDKFQILPNRISFLTSPGLQADRDSIDLLPSDVPDAHFPVQIQGDGNCFPRTLSLLAFRDQEKHVEMRVRIIVESVLNFKKYTSPAYLARGSSDNGDELLRAMIMYTSTPFHSATEAFKSELLLIKAPSRECGMWQMFVAANILHARVTSIFPDKGTVDVRNLCKRTVLPEVELSEPCFIMWTSHRVDMVDDYWLGTHFVPLVPLGESVMVMVEGDDCEDEFNSAFCEENSVMAFLAEPDDEGDNEPDPTPCITGSTR